MNKSLLLLVTLLIPINSLAESCRYSKDYDFSIEAASLTTLMLDVGAGSLSIEGDPTIDEVKIAAVACASSRNRLEELDVTHRVRDTSLLVRAGRQKNPSLFSWLSLAMTYSHIDLSVTMPTKLFLDVTDGSGSVHISNVSGLTLDDGSGSIRISDTEGDVRIMDGSGSINILGVKGKVSVEDGSGPISIRDSAEVTIIEDGSGSISIEDISGNVIIRNDGSGGISVHDIAGDVEIGAAGSGSVDVRRVAGNYLNRNK